MSEQQSSHEQHDGHDFGKIEIIMPKQAEVPEGKPVRPRSSASRLPRQKKSSGQGGRKAADASRRKQPGNSRWYGLLALAFLLMLPALYLLFCLFGLPLLIKGPLAQRLSQQFGRPVSIGEASLSPFSFDLHLAEIAVGADGSQPELAKIETADAHIRPASLLRGKLVLEDVRIDRLRAALVRRADGSLNSPLPGGSLALLPDWLRVQGLRLSRGTIHFFDQPSGRKHLAEQIEFVLPNTGGEEKDKAVEPVLSAMVNSSPVQVRGRRIGAETRLALTLNDLDLQPHLGWLPGLADSMTVSAARADAVLELIVPDQEAEQGLTVTGALTATSLLVQSAAEDAVSGFQLHAPKAKVVLRARPLRSQYAVEELNLEEPQLELAGKEELDGGQLAAKAAALLNHGGINLTADNVSLRRGGIKSGGQAWTDVQSQAWTDVQIELNGFQNAKAAAATEEKKTASLNLSAKRGKAAVSFSGAAAPDFALSGTVELKNMEAGLLQPYLAGDGLRLVQGAADLSGALQLDSQGMSISGGAVALRDFSIQRNKTALVKGKTLNGADCAFGLGRSIACGKLALDQAYFAADAPSLFLIGGGKKGKQGGLNLAANTVEIKNSAANLPLAGAAPLALSGLNLSLDGQDNFRLSAAAGQGRLEISGAAAKTDSGLVLSGALSLQDMDAGLLNPSLSQGGEIRFAQGRAEISGAGSLTAATGGAVLRLSGGSVAVRDFVLQNSGAALLSGKTLQGADCAFDGGGLACGNLALEQADFAAAAPAFFLSSNGALRFSSKTTEIKNSTASLPLAGATPLALSGLNLSLDGENKLELTAAAGPQGRIEISGAAAKADSGTGLSGSISLKGMDAAILNRYVSPGGEVRFVKGGADISGTGNLSAGVDGIVLTLAVGAMFAHDFSLQHGGAALLSGKTLHGADCALANSGLTCGKLALDQADFAATAPAFFLRPAGRLQFSAAAVEIAKSSALLPLGAGTLALSDVKMDLSGGSLRLEAAANGSSVKAEGTLDRNGSGALALTAADLDLRQFSTAAGLFQDSLAIKQGSLSLQGQLILPEGRFSGEFSMARLEAENSQGDGIRWELLTGSGATAALSPLSASAASLSLQAPSVRLASAKGGIAAGLLALLHDMPILSAEQSSLSNGSVELADGPGFSGIEGSIAPLRADSEAAFTLAGKMNGSNFAVKGKAGNGGIDIAELTIERLILAKAAQILAGELGADKDKAQLSRTISPSEDRLELSGFTPAADSDFALTLALLTDERGGFSLPLHGLSAGASEAAVSAVAFEELRRLQSQDAAPEKLLPALAALPQSADFLPGDKVTDFMRGLEGYGEALRLRPHLGLAVRGCFDKEADLKSLLATLHKEEDGKLKEENRRREEEMRRLTAEEILRQQALQSAGQPLDKDNLPAIRQREDLQPVTAKQSEAPDKMLADLAQARAEVIREHLVSKMKLPPERVKMQESADCGARAELQLTPVW